MCSNWPTFPQIFIKGEFVGGSDIILNMHQASELIVTDLITSYVQLDFDFVDDFLSQFSSERWA